MGLPCPYYYTESITRGPSGLLPLLCYPFKRLVLGESWGTPPNPRQGDQAPQAPIFQALTHMLHCRRSEVLAQRGVYAVVAFDDVAGHVERAERADQPERVAAAAERARLHQGRRRVQALAQMRYRRAE